MPTTTDAPLRVFLHGWGQAPESWSWSDRIPGGDDLLLPLPGHGKAEEAPATAWVDRLEAQLPPQRPLHLIGWSLGAMLALEIAARQYRRVVQLDLYAATPCFLRRPDWPHGIDRQSLHALVDHLIARRDPARFVRLMVHGVIGNRARLRAFTRDYLASLPPPQPAGLRAGAALLEQLDLRATAAAVRQPVTLWHGTEDRIVPIAAAEWLSRRLPHAELHRLAGRGHMPWIDARGMPPRP